MTAWARLRRDFEDLVRDPSPSVRAAFDDSNLLIWHFIFVGEKGTPFEGGYYYGKIKFAREFPFKPPSYTVQTANGRFEVGRKVCITNSSYHGENWNPLWTVGGLLTGLVGFFHDTNELNFIGSCPNQTIEKYKKYAADSKTELLRVLELEPEVKNLFYDIVQQVQRELDGADSQHRLPIMREHFEWLAKEERRKLLDAADANHDLFDDD